jgi:DNA-binding HxlR family transcriptional regulator
VVNGSGNGARSGAQTLMLLAAPLELTLLRALTAGPKRQAELQRDTGSPAQTTLRAQLKRLVEIGAVEKHRRNRFPGVLEYELTASGGELHFVAEVLERWLERAPHGPLQLGGNAAKAAVKALADGWSTTILRALAAGPLSLTQLDGVIAAFSYPALERRLAAMRLANQIEAQPSNGRGTPYAVTRWLRHGLAPLSAASRWEARHRREESAPIRRLDTETAFLLTVPLLRPAADLSGSCRLAAEVPDGGQRRLAGVIAEVRNGAIVSCTTNLQGHTDAWALGTPGAWLDALVLRDTARLELGGDGQLATALLDGLHDVLFDPRPATRP